MTIYEILKPNPKAKEDFCRWLNTFDELSDYLAEKVKEDTSLPIHCFWEYKTILYDYLDSKSIICTIRTNWKGDFIPTVNDVMNRNGLGKGKVYSRSGMSTRQEAEQIMFKKAFDYLETIL